MRPGLLVILLGLAVPVCAETDDDGIAQFFTCLENGGAPGSALDDACYVDLRDAVPGWCPLMDNQIRSRQGVALIKAARDLDAAHPIFAEGWDLCPELSAVSLPPGNSKAALCQQSVGIKVLKAVRASERYGGG